jgi:hypothetical protein
VHRVIEVFLVELDFKVIKVLKVFKARKVLLLVE